jgi:hypothetical protein
VKNGEPRDRIRVTRRIAIALAIIVFGSVVGAAGVFASAVASDLLQSQLTLAVGIFAFTVIGVAACFIVNDSVGLPSGLGLASWFDVPRYVWIIGGIGLVMVLVSVGDALALKQ